MWLFKWILNSMFLQCLDFMIVKNNTFQLSLNNYDHFAVAIGAFVVVE